jgi:hypothetical protein
MRARLIRLTIAVALAMVPALAIIAASAQSQSEDARLTLTVVSGRPDLIIGGDALIRIAGGGAWSNPALTVNGKPATVANIARVGPGSAVMGLITGLPVGKSTLAVMTPQSSVSLDLMNHPIAGPVFSGPHQKPFVCQTESWKLGPPQDENCTAPTKVEWQYKSTAPVQGRGASAFKTYDRAAARPADLADATVNGRKVPYIVRVETGTFPTPPAISSRAKIAAWCFVCT